MILRRTKELGIKPESIVSLVPSQTELLHYLCLENETIAITKFCIHPIEWFRSKIRIGGTKSIDIEKIISLAPDLIIANKEENIKEQVEILAQKFNVWVTDVNDVEDALQMMKDIGDLTKKEKEATVLIELINKKFTLLPSPPLPTVAYLIWNNPFMTIGGDTFISDMLFHAGFKNVFARRKRYPEVTIGDINNSNCDYVFLSSEPYPFSQMHRDLLQSHLPHTKIILVDGEMFSWYGSRMLYAAAYIETLKAQLFNV